MEIEILSEQLRDYGDWLFGLATYEISDNRFSLRDAVNDSRCWAFSALLDGSGIFELQVDGSCGDSASITLDAEGICELGREMHALSVAPEGAEVSAVECTSVRDLACSYEHKGGVWGRGVYLDLRGTQSPAVKIPLSIDGLPVVSVDASASNVEVVDASAASYLKWLNISGSGVKELHCPLTGSLVCLDCSVNAIESLDLRTQERLEVLLAFEGRLKEISFASAGALRWVDVSGNGLDSLDASECLALEVLDCSRNEISSLRLAGGSALKRLICAENRLKKLPLSCDGLVFLDCSQNMIKELDLSGAIYLNSLRCSDNELKDLCLDALPALSELYCFGNNLSNVRTVEEWLVRHGAQGQISPQGKAFAGDAL